MLITASPAETFAILGAMRDVAAPPSPADRASIEAAYRYIFRGVAPLDVDALPPTPPDALARALATPDLAREALRFLAVMALVDGVIDEAKIARVLGYASALGVREHYLRQLAQAAAGRLKQVGIDMMRQNVRSIPGLVWNAEAVDAIFLPYAGDRADAALTARYEALAHLAPGTFGHTFWAHYHKNGYPFPGRPDGLNERFATPHDSTHVLSGYDTTPRGEVLVSTFTAAMHRREPMSGHVLPVIFSWHLGIQLNAVAKSATGALDPEAFWLAWERGARITTDTFAPSWDFWAVVDEPLDALRRRYGIPPLDPDRDATRALLTD